MENFETKNPKTFFYLLNSALNEKLKKNLVEFLIIENEEMQKLYFSKKDKIT